MLKTYCREPNAIYLQLENATAATFQQHLAESLGALLKLIDDLLGETGESQGRLRHLFSRARPNRIAVLMTNGVIRMKSRLYEWGFRDARVQQVRHRLVHGEVVVGFDRMVGDEGRLNGGDMDRW